MAQRLKDSENSTRDGISVTPYPKGHFYILSAPDFHFFIIAADTVEVLL